MRADWWDRAPLGAGVRSRRFFMFSAPGVRERPSPARGGLIQSPGEDLPLGSIDTRLGVVMTGVFEVLGKDHAEVKQMLAELEAGPASSSGASASDLAQRRKIVERLVIDESRHEAVEEMYFWPAVRDKLADGDKLAATAIEQEQEGKEVLAKLDKLDASEPEFEKLVAMFIQAGREHITYEETQVGLRRALTAQEADDLGSKIEQGKKTAPTRPHPHTPPSPAVLQAAAPAAAAADRARDGATGRGN